MTFLDHLLDRPTLYLVRVRHAAQNSRTWLRLSLCPADAVAWADKHWPAAEEIKVSPLRAPRSLAVMPSWQA